MTDRENERNDDYARRATVAEKKLAEIEEILAEASYAETKIDDIIEVMND